MSASDVPRVEELIRREQPEVDRIYEVADAKVARRIDGIVQGANAKDIVDGTSTRRTSAEGLEIIVTDPTRLLVFGRADRSDGPDGDLETLYVGRVGLPGDDGQPVLVSWKGHLGELIQTKPEAAHVHRKLDFDGRDRTLDDVIERRFGPDVPVREGRDPLLVRLERTVDGHLRETPETLQEEQYALMSEDPGRLLVIQGAPGTGKTIVGLHRVSVMIYRSEGRIQGEDILVVGPSSTFVEYISDLLPALGDVSVPQLDIATVGLPDNTLSTGEPDDPRSREVKGRAVMAEVIESYLQGRIRSGIASTIRLGNTRLTKVDRLEERIATIKSRGAPYAEKRRSIRQALVQTQGIPDEPSTRVTADLNRALDRFAPGYSPQQVVAEMLSSPDLLEAAARDLLTPSDQTAIRQSKANLSEITWSLDDVPLLDEARAQVQGLSDLRRYAHVVVDEAQDLSPMQVRMLRRRSKGGMTILGDLAQGTSPWRQVTWEQQLGAGGIEMDPTTDLREMTTVYRTVKPIVEVAGRLLPVIDVDVPLELETVREGDGPPTRLEASSTRDLAAQVADRVADVLTSADEGTVGIIGLDRDLDALMAAFSDTSEGWGFEFAWAQDRLDKKVSLVRLNDVKGLEFDHVVVLEPQQIYRQDSTTGPAMLYVAMTRARTSLTLAHSSPLPPILDEKTMPLAPVAVPDGAGGLSSAGEVDTPLPPRGEAPQVPQEPQPTPPGPEQRPDIETGVDQGVSADGREAGEDAPAYVSGRDALDVEVDQTWARVVPHGDRLYLVDVSGHAAQVRLIPGSGGKPTFVAHGHVVTDGEFSAWALQTSRGPMAITTGADLQASAETVVRSALDASDGEVTRMGDSDVDAQTPPTWKLRRPAGLVEELVVAGLDRSSAEMTAKTVGDLADTGLYAQAIGALRRVLEGEMPVLLADGAHEAALWEVLPRLLHATREPTEVAQSLLAGAVLSGGVGEYAAFTACSEPGQGAEELEREAEYPVPGVRGPKDAKLAYARLDGYGGADAQRGASARGDAESLERRFGPPSDRYGW